ncbi:MAG TPA: hypothetical protein VFK16_02990 [Gemmatimonadaceae bacterium]|jgi:hypothetical protein|nr:hypothetical protein [Gemmatimonadaceae bacterium]
MILASMVRASAWLLQAVAIRPDTIVTREIVERAGFDQVIHVVGGLLLILLLLLALLAVPAAWYLRNRLHEMTVTLRGIREELHPVLTRTASVLDDMEHISTTVRRDISRVSGAVERLDDQLRDLTDAAGHRLRDFDALVGAVHDEAEGLFLTTASAARGVRAGVRALRRHRARRAEREALAAEADARDSADEDDSSMDEDQTDRPREPRLRKRRRAR